MKTDRELHVVTVVLDAVGPETYAYEDLVRLVRERIGSRSRLVHVPPSLGLIVGKAAGVLLRAVVITRDEIAGLMANLLVSHQPPTCATKFSEWLSEHAKELGREYASEVGRHY